MNVNKTIHEAMGEKWHERGGKDQDGDVVCSCGGWWPEHDRLNVDYTDPVHYCALMDWMRGDDRVANLEFWACQGSAGVIYIDFENWMHSTRQEQITLIAEAIEAGVLK